MTTSSDNPFDEAPYDEEADRAKICKEQDIRTPTQLEITNLAATLLASSTDKDKPSQERTWEAVHLAIKLWKETEAQLLDAGRHETNPFLGQSKTMGLYCLPMMVSNHFLPHIKGGFEDIDCAPYKKFLEQTVGLSRPEDREKWFGSFLVDFEKISTKQAAEQLETYEKDGFPHPAMTARLYRVWRINHSSDQPSTRYLNASETGLKEALEAGKNELIKKK